MVFVVGVFLTVGKDHDGPLKVSLLGACTTEKKPDEKSKITKQSNRSIITKLCIETDKEIYSRVLII